MPDRNDRKRIGVIGLGLIAQVAHLPALQRLADRVVVSHVCDIAPGLADAVAERLPGQPIAVTDWTDLLGDDGPDAVVVCTPGSHGRIAEAFLSAGVSVLAEKPLCLTRAEADRLGAVAADNDAVLEVAYMKTHDDVVDLASVAYRQLSDPRLVRVTVLHPDDAPQVAHLTLLRGAELDQAAHSEVATAVEYERARVAEAVGDDPVLQRLYSDILNGSVVHEMSLVRTVTGRLPEWISAAASPLGTDEPPCIQAVGRLDDRTDVILSWNWLPTYPDHETEFAVFGDDGRLTMVMEPPYTRRRTTMQLQTIAPGASADAATVRQTRSSTTGYESSFDLQMEHFVDQLAGGPGRNGSAEASADIEALQALCVMIARSADRPISGEAVQ